MKKYNVCLIRIVEVIEENYFLVAAENEEKAVNGAHYQDMCGEGEWKITSRSVVRDPDVESVELDD